MIGDKELKELKKDCKDPYGPGSDCLDIFDALRKEVPGMVNEILQYQKIKGKRALIVEGNSCSSCPIYDFMIFVAWVKRIAN